MLGAAAAGLSLGDAIARMAPPPGCHAARVEHRATYDELYRAYRSGA